MTTLSQLNASSKSPIEYTDVRPAGVIFDRFATRDDIFTVSNLNRPLVPQIGISEIINYATANVRYRLTINSTRAAYISGSTLTFNGMPTGVSVATVTTTYAKQYTVSGFTSAANWEQIKTPTWNIPVDFALSNTWWVKSEIIYYDAAISQDVTREWYVFDPEYYYFAQLSSQSAVSATVGNKKPLAAALSASFEFNSDAPFKRFVMTTTVNAYITANGRKARLLSANLSTPAATFTASSRKTARPTVAFTSAFTVACQAGEIVRPINRIDLFAVFGPIGPAGVPYLEGNGFPYATGLGSWPQGFPGIVRIKSSPVAITATSTVTCIGADARLVSAMVMSAGTMTISATRIPGIIRNLTANFSVNLPDGGNIEGGRAQFGGEFYATATPFYSLGFFSNMTSATSLTAAPRYTGIIPTVTNRNYVDIAAYGNELYAMVRQSDSTRGLWKWTGSGDFTQVEQTTPFYWDALGVTTSGDVYAVTNRDNSSSLVLGQLYNRPAGSSFSSLGQTLRDYAAVEITGSDVYVVSQTLDAGTYPIYKLVSGTLTKIVGFGEVVYDITFKDGYIYILARSGNNSRIIKNKVANTYSSDVGDYTTIWRESFDGDGSYGIPEAITVASGNVYVAFNNSRPGGDGDGSISGSVWRLTDSNTTDGASLTAITIPGYNWIGLATTTDGTLYGIVPSGGLYVLAYTS